LNQKLKEGAKIADLPIRYSRQQSDNLRAVNKNKRLIKHDLQTETVKRVTKRLNKNCNFKLTGINSFDTKKVKLFSHRSIDDNLGPQQHMISQLQVLPYPKTLTTQRPRGLFTFIS
jgi:hypothetical protein